MNASRIQGSYQNYQKCSADIRLKYIEDASISVDICHSGNIQRYPVRFYGLNVSYINLPPHKIRSTNTTLPIQYFSMIEVIGCKHIAETYTYKGVIFYQSPYF